MSKELDRSLRNTHRTLLGMIAVCAIMAAIQLSDVEEPAPDPVITTVAVGLALGTIVARRASTSPVISQPTRVTLILCAYAFAFAIALLGATLATNSSRPQTGLVFALAAGIFSLRPPPRFGSDH
jgi:hypothetical protein